MMAFVILEKIQQLKQRSVNQFLSGRGGENGRLDDQSKWVELKWVIFSTKRAGLGWVGLGWVET